MDEDVVVNKKGTFFWRKRKVCTRFKKKTETEKDTSWGRVEAGVISESFHVHSDVPQTPIKGFVDRMH